MSAMEDDGFFFRQLLPGRDIAINPSTVLEAQLFSMSHRMLNCIYLVGDTFTNDCVVIDPCWDVEGIRREASLAGMRIVAAVATHAHPDHIGGFFPFPLNHIIQPCRIPGIKEFIESGLKVYMHPSEMRSAMRQTEVPRAALLPIANDQLIHVGSTTLKLIHTPGHCAGAICILMSDGEGIVRGLLSGDTLLPGTFGRVDLPGSCPTDMQASLKVLSCMADNIVVYPGHHYGRMRQTSIGRERAIGFLNPQHDGKLKALMMPRLWMRALTPLVSLVYPFIQRSRYFPFIAAFGFLIFLRMGMYGLLAFCIVARLVI